MVQYSASSSARMMTRSRARQLMNSYGSTQLTTPVELEGHKQSALNSPINEREVSSRLLPVVEWTDEIREFLRAQIVAEFPHIGLNPYIVGGNSPHCKKKWEQIIKQLSTKFNVYVSLEDAQFEWFLFTEHYSAQYGEVYSDGLPINRLIHLYEYMMALEYDSNNRQRDEALETDN